MKSTISHVLLFLTYRCNLRCSFCLSFDGYWQPDPSVPLPVAPFNVTREMTTAEIVDRVIPQCAEHGVRVMALSGGESMIRKDATVIFRALGTSPMKWCLDSNLMLCDNRIAEEIITASCDTVFSSLDGSRGVHNRLRGSPLAFDRFSAGLKRLVRAREQQQDCHTRITINCTVQPGNESEAPLVTQIAADHGVNEVTFQLKSARKYEQPFRTGEAKQAIDQAFQIAADNGLRMYTYPLDRPDENNLRAWFAGPYEGNFFKGCNYIHGSARIDPAGNVIPCLEHRVGNILDEDLDQIWSGAAYQLFRERIMRQGPLEACLRCCNMKAKVPALAAQPLEA